MVDTGSLLGPLFVYICVLPVMFIVHSLFPGSQFRGLHSKAKAVSNSAFAEGTRANMVTQIKTFIRFCIYFGLKPFPASQDIVRAYIVFLSISFKSVQSVKNYVHAIKIVHLVKSIPFPDLSSFSFKLLYKGLTRQSKHTPKQALPITPPILVQIHSILDLSSPLHTTLWSSFLLSFFLFARKSNMVPQSPSKFDPDKHLMRKDISVCKSGMIVTIKWSKNIQCSERRLRIPIAAVPGSCLCPLRAYINMCTMVPAASNSPAFVVPSHRPLTTVTHYTFTSSLRGFLSQLSFNPGAYSGHSFRRGGATWAFQSGVPGELIQLHRDWRSEAYKLYLKVSLDKKWSVTAAIRDSIYQL